MIIASMLPASSVAITCWQSPERTRGEPDDRANAEERSLVGVGVTGFVSIGLFALLVMAHLVVRLRIIRLMFCRIILPRRAHPKEMSHQPVGGAVCVGVIHAFVHQRTRDVTLPCVRVVCIPFHFAHEMPVGPCGAPVPEIPQADAKRVEPATRANAGDWSGWREI